MSNSSESSNRPNILGNIASIVGLLGISLYFTGWIYRWAYYGFYKLEVTTLDLPLESFLLVPIQVLFGNPKAIINTVIAILLTPFLIYLTLGLFAVLVMAIHWLLNTLTLRTTLQFFNRSIGLLDSRVLQLMRSLFSEIVIVFWVLLILFHLARHQGFADTRRDAINKTSTLPVVTFLTSQNQLILGKELEGFDKFLFDANVEGYHIIGDVGLAQKIQEEGINDLKEESMAVINRTRRLDLCLSYPIGKCKR